MKRLIVELELHGFDNLTDETTIDVLREWLDGIDEGQDIEIIRIVKPDETK